MKMLYKYRLRKGLFFLICIVINSLDSGAQYVDWSPANAANGVVGSYTGGVVTASLTGTGNPLSFTSPAPNQNNLVVTGGRTFFTEGPWDIPPAQSLTFNFTIPVIITRFNVADINTGNDGSRGWNDSYDFSGISFSNFNGTNCSPTVTGVTATSGSGNNSAFASWFSTNSCSVINAFTINFRNTSGLTTAWLAYSMEVCAPFNQIDVGPFCLNSTPVSLPTIIACGITGVWNPATVNTNVAGSFPYTFTPNAGQTITCPITTNITIKTINDCCLPTLTATGNITTMVQEQRSDWISSTNVISFNDGVAGHGVIYHAGNFVELVPGFETVASGTQFAAYPQACSGNFAYRPQNNTNPVQEIINTIKQNSVINKYHDLIYTGMSEADVLKRIEISKPVVIYPNPANNNVEIVMQKIKFKRISIMTMDGKKLYEKNFVSTYKFQVDINRYVKGIYIVNITTDDGQSFSKKLIKN